MDTVIPNVLEHVDMQLDAAGTVVVWCKALSSTSTSTAVARAEVQLNCCIELVRTFLPVGHNLDLLFRIFL